MGLFTVFSKKSDTDLSWLGVDIHSHVLPGVDDGSPDAETSVGYLQRLQQLGLYRFYATPHVHRDVHPNTPETIQTALRALRARLPDIAILDAAAEYMVDETFKALYDQELLLTLPGKHVLIEMSYAAESRIIDRTIFDLQVHGYTPILAHPERYVYYHGDTDRYKRYKDLGCLLQVNLLSPAGYYGAPVKRAAMALLHAGLVDLAGTDLHHAKHLVALEKFVLSGNAHRAFRKNDIKNASLFAL